MCAMGQGPGRSPVTFVGFAERDFPPDPTRGTKGGRCLSQYATTRTDVMSYFTGSRKHVPVPADGKVCLSSGSGCDFHCCTIVDDASQSLVVGNEEGVFFFSPEVRYLLLATV